MTLLFPTKAERCLQEWRGRRKTVSLNVVAKKHGALRENEGTVRVWVFDDDTTLRAVGTGRNLRVEATLP
jgi:hypothetical protein